VPVWKDLSERYSPMGFNFTMVYIMEAHADDEWPISSSRYMPNGEKVAVNQHKTMEERLDAAFAFRDKFDLRNSRILVDDMLNTFNNAYAAWPFRYWVVDGKEVRLVGMPDVSEHGDKFSSQPLEDFLSYYDYNYDKPESKARASSRAGSMARMLHYSSGRKGYNNFESQLSEPSVATAMLHQMSGREGYSNLDE